MQRHIKISAAGETLPDEATEFAVIRDTELNLEWGPTFPQQMTHAEAEKACAELGMRLPTLQEMETSVRDITRFDPAVYPAFSADTLTDDWYWTASPDASGPGCAWIVGFGCGDSRLYRRDVRYWVRPVRASQ